MSSATNVRRVALTAALAIAAVLLSALAFAQPASAGATDCAWGSGKVCLYKNSSYATGGIERYAGSDRYYSTSDTFDHCWYSCRINDAVSSIKNRGNRMSTMHYEHSRYRGDRLFILRNAQIDLWGHWANNELSSHRWV